MDIEAPLSSQTYTPASTLTVPANGRIAFVNGDETNSTEKTDILDALGFSTADLADTSLLVIWHQSISLDNAGETLRLTYQKAPTDSILLVDELYYGNALGGIDSLSALQHDSLWAYAPAPNALRRTSFSGAGNTFRTSAYSTSVFRGEGINIPTPLGPILANATYADHERGKRLYELKNHLGNVTTVVSDRKVPYFNGSSELVYFSPDIASAQDYYPFGSIMPGRSFSSGYRYGFQGQEQDDEVKGDGNSVNYKYRVHDPRLGKFLSIDPLAPEYPFYSPYAFSGNRVIDKIELEGLEQAEIDRGAYYPAGDQENLGRVNDNFDASQSEVDERVENDESIREFNLFKNPIAIHGYRTPEAISESAPKEQTANNNELWNARIEAWEQYQLDEKNRQLDPIRHKLGNDPWIQLALDLAMSGGGAGLRTQWKRLFNFEDAVNSAAKPYVGASYAFFSGEGARAMALRRGYTILTDTRAGLTLMRTTAHMVYKPGTHAYKAWAELSASYARSIPKGSKITVFLTREAAKNPNSIWNAVERPILQKRHITIVKEFLD